MTLPRPTPVTRRCVSSSHQWCPFAVSSHVPPGRRDLDTASSGSTIVSPTVARPTPFVITEFRGGQEIHSGGFFRKGSFLLEKVTFG